MPNQSPGRDFVIRAYTVGISGSAESGRPMLFRALCRLLCHNYSLAVLTRQQPADLDGSREFLIRHKALACSRIVAVDGDRQTAAAIESLMTEFRPELIFLEDVHGAGDIDTLADFTIHVVNGSGDELVPDDVPDTVSADVLVLNKTHLGPPLNAERNVSVRDAVRIRGDAPYVFADLRYDLGTIEIARHVLASWRQTSAPAVWATAVERDVALTVA